MVSTAICEASTTDGFEAIANVLAGPAFLMVVVGFVIETPGFSSISNPPVALAESPDFVEPIAVGTKSNVKPIVFCPLELGMSSDLVVCMSGFVGGEVIFLLTSLIPLLSF